ncbi:unnamed protein product [Nezara viridula]|uniref:Uncharacterized protein n=1 Tax=Nezara viridula TaxID=85310 RepID=A0A9P0MRE6_NEZVI|nr:unnamed protein product [Nezara viridula]
MIGHLRKAESTNDLEDGSLIPGGGLAKDTSSRALTYSWRPPRPMMVVMKNEVAILRARNSGPQHTTMAALSANTLPRSLSIIRDDCSRCEGRPNWMNVAKILMSSGGLAWGLYGGVFYRHDSYIPLTVPLALKGDTIRSLILLSCSYPSTKGLSYPGGYNKRVVGQI